ncbi:MAG: HigA family addiction module antidote protein [Deltaproteobacteria bacterium]|nr:HigA family addiction module antidote protein [Deltaproteobacteria bacterium]
MRLRWRFHGKPEEGVSPSTFNRLLNGESNISPGMALRLSKSLGRSPESWLIMQNHYDLWHARKKINLKHVKKHHYSQHNSRSFQGVSIGTNTAATLSRSEKKEALSTRRFDVLTVIREKKWQAEMMAGVKLIF